MSTRPIKVLIVEDKSIIAEDVAVRLRRHGIDVTGICSSGEEAIAFAKVNELDLIIMDIELGGAIDGISAASLILEDQNVSIIYLTEHTDPRTMDRARKTFPANYLTKPFNEDDLVRAVELAFNNAGRITVSDNKNPLSTDIFIKTDAQVFKKLAFDDILCLQAERAYCKVVTAEQEFVLATSMNHIHEQLNNVDFVRVHRSSIVNLKRVTALNGNVIRLGEHEVLMSKEYRENFMKFLKIVK
jgi:DNA-binding LytR/AlgR family response regulator